MPNTAPCGFEPVAGATPGPCSDPAPDVSWLDLATTEPTRILAAAVPIETAFLPLSTGGILVSNDRTKFVYPIITGDAPGIYVAKLP